MKADLCRRSKPSRGARAEAGSGAQVCCDSQPASGERICTDSFCSCQGPGNTYLNNIDGAFSALRGVAH